MPHTHIHTQLNTKTIPVSMVDTSLPSETSHLCDWCFRRMYCRIIQPDRYSTWHVTRRKASALTLLPSSTNDQAKWLPGSTVWEINKWSVDAYEMHDGKASRKGPTLRPIIACDWGNAISFWQVHCVSYAMFSQTSPHSPFNMASVLFQGNVPSLWLLWMWTCSPIWVTEK